MTGRLIEENLFVKHSIVHPDSEEGQRIHNYLLGRAKALAGRHIDFDTTPVTFVLSDSDAVNAFYAPVTPDHYEPRRQDHRTIRYIKNPVDTPVICVMRGLIDMVETRDQLDFVLGHELTHMMIRGYGIKHNSKGEEMAADLHAVDLMYDAGADPKQALRMQEKLAVYQKENKERLWREQNSNHNEEERGIDWSAIFDVHMTSENTVAGIEASLTRLSHLIDERAPAPLDKSVFDARYTDVVDDYLDTRGYSEKSAHDKLKILVDCIDHLAYAPTPAEEHFRSELAALPEPDIDRDDYFWILRRREELQKRIDAGCSGYFEGAVIDKKYQQKIAQLAEKVIKKVEEEASNSQDKGETPAEWPINGEDLNLYLQNKAYPHILANSYPKRGDENELEAAGILYSYFFQLFLNHDRDMLKHLTGGQREGPLPQIEIDIADLVPQIRNAQTADEFVVAAEAYQCRQHILHEIRTVKYDGRVGVDKLDNLTAYDGPRTYGAPRPPGIYERVDKGDAIPWDNLTAIARSDAGVKDRIVEFLNDNYIEDYRITHDLPYIDAGPYYQVEDDGRTVGSEVPVYEVHYALHRDLVLQGYEHVRSYFDGEADFIDRKCDDALGITYADFEGAKTPFGRDATAARKKIYDFISAFNALPDERNPRSRFESPDVRDFIPVMYLQDHPLPGSKRKRFNDERIEPPPYTRKLLQLDNPVFREHFGDNFEQELIARKRAQSQQMFEATLKLLDKACDMWLDAKPKLELLREKSDALWRTFGQASDQDNKRLGKKRRKVASDRDFYRAVEDEMSSAIFNILDSVLDVDKYPFMLQKISPEQKRALAEYAVRDEKGAIRQILGSYNREYLYDHLCDYLGILEDQTDRAIAGDYRLSENMQFLAGKHGYSRAETAGDLKAFHDANPYAKYDRDASKYPRYLHMFDLMQYLEQSPEIDIRVVANAIEAIEQPSFSCLGRDPGDLIEERYKNYRKFILESNLLALAGPAIARGKNYDRLNPWQALEAADSLARVGGNIRDIVRERRDPYDWSGKEMPIPDPAHRQFVKLVDRKVQDTLRQAENLALENFGPLDKFEFLYSYYNPPKYSRDAAHERDPYLEKRKHAEKSIAKLTAKADDPSFWPVDVLEHVKAYVLAKNTFLDDKDREDRILNTILDKLACAPASKGKNECFHILLDKKLRAAYPQTRERLFDLYVRDVAHKLGPDDTSEKYQRRLAVYLQALEDKEEDEINHKFRKPWDTAHRRGAMSNMLSYAVAPADKHTLLRKLSDAVVSQEETSQMFRNSLQLRLDSRDMVMSYLYGIGVDYLSEEMDRDPAMAQHFIEFLNSKGESGDCEKISGVIAKLANERYSDDHMKHRRDEIINNTKPGHCKILYENFWSAPLEARAVIIARILNSAEEDTSPESDTGYARPSWQAIFDRVMDTLIPGHDTSLQARYARDIMHSYVKCRSDYERVLIMSAMMIANRNLGDDVGNVGKALKLFLENAGPAEIKLGQAIHSHPDTPADIRDELQALKNAAGQPPRWTLYDWIRTEQIPDDLWKNRYLGKILGSASYFTTAELGDDQVLRILRPEAREKAAKGFRVIGAAIEDLKGREAGTGMNYDRLTWSVQEMIAQAARMSSIETDTEIGYQQSLDAADIYDDVSLQSGGEAFNMKVMDWQARGKNWMVMDRARGLMFNELPEDTPGQIISKRAFAKAYIVFELRTILSGKKFDHDKHGAQLSIDPETNRAGIYDTGAMALQAPTPQDQQNLGNVIYTVLRHGMQGQDPFDSFARVIDGKIDTLRTKGEETRYLIEVKKAMLALGDFFAVLPKEDMKEILPAIDMSRDISPHVRAGITQNMSWFEKAQFNAYLAGGARTAKGGVVITMPDRLPQVHGPVVSSNAEPVTRPKAQWLDDLFAPAGSGSTGGQGPSGRRSSITGGNTPDRKKAFATEVHNLA